MDALVSMLLFSLKTAFKDIHPQNIGHYCRSFITYDLYTSLGSTSTRVVSSFTEVTDKFTCSYKNDCAKLGIFCYILQKYSKI